jgi:hypothetical protein
LLPAAVVPAFCTCVVTLAVLFEASESDPLLETVAVLVTLPLTLGVTLIVTVADEPLAIVPRLQVTFPDEFEQEPWDVAAD